MPQTPVAPATDDTPVARAKKKWQDIEYAKPPVTWWCYSGREIAELREFLAANDLTPEDIGTTEEKIQKVLVRRHMLAAEEAWRLCFKNDSGWSVAGRIAQMEVNLTSAGKTRLDLGLLEDGTEWLTQHPDLEAAMMNAGRIKWVPRMWDHINQRFQIFVFDDKGALVPRQS